MSLEGVREGGEGGVGRGGEGREGGREEGREAGEGWRGGMNVIHIITGHNI